jgi:hypothetical protein
LTVRALAEIIGNHKPPTATAEDISKAALEVIRGSQIADWVATGRVIASSADRCAICLDDYEADQDCRVMSCSASPACRPFRCFRQSELTYHLRPSLLAEHIYVRFCSFWLCLCWRLCLLTPHSSSPALQHQPCIDSWLSTGRNACPACRTKVRTPR